MLKSVTDTKTVIEIAGQAVRVPTSEINRCDAAAPSPKCLNDEGGIARIRVDSFARPRPRNRALVFAGSLRQN